MRRESFVPRLAGLALIILSALYSGKPPCTENKEAINPPAKSAYFPEITQGYVQQRPEDPTTPPREIKLEDLREYFESQRSLQP